MSDHFISPVISEIFQQLLQQAADGHQRRMLVCAGDAQWCEIVAHSLAQGLPNDSRKLFVGEGGRNIIPEIQARQSQQWLGRELDFLVINAHSGFDVDAFGALSGTLCAGGILLLLTPELKEWPSLKDPEHRRIQVYPQALAEVSGYYLQRLARLVQESSLISVVSQEQGVISKGSILSNHITVNEKSSVTPCKTESQQLAVVAVHKVVRGHRRRPLVLTADRGRGKSAALGIAAGQLLNEGLEKILVTAPAKKTTEVLYRHAVETVNPDINPEEQLEFMAPDELINQNPSADLLLVDEAAAISTPVLEKLLNKYSRIVFASTIHGYEGTGRGFAIRFRKTLDEKTPQWRSLHINQPIRWAANDPLEAFVFRALLLDSDAADSRSFSLSSDAKPEFRRIEPAELVQNEELLNELFGLLVLAHYQTRPFDLRHMLDGGNIEIYGLFQNGHLLATTLAAREGGIEESLKEPIWLGQRRVRGHLLPQSLSNHLGVSDAVTLKGLRVIRIAVHPELQQQGLGLAMLDHLIVAIKARRFDYLGTSFGATPQLLDFWNRAGLIPIRTGITREASSGCHSVLMIKPLSDAGMNLANECLLAFRSQFFWLLPEELQQLEAGIVARLLKYSGIKPLEAFHKFYQRDLQSYIHGQRQYDCCIAAIKALTPELLAGNQLNEQQQSLLAGKVLQNRSWTVMAKQLELTGKKQVQALMRETFAHITNLRKTI